MNFELPEVPFSELSEDAQNSTIALLEDFVEQLTKDKNFPAGEDEAVEEMIRFLDQGYIKLRKTEKGDMGFLVYHHEEDRYIMHFILKTITV